MQIELADCENVLLREVAMPEIKRNGLALTYALAMRSGETVDWTRVNQCIMDRWSKSGLTYIKERAWKIMEGKIQP